MIERSSTGYSYGQLDNLSFLLIGIGIITWTVWMIIIWMKNTHYLTITRLIITGEYYYTNDDDLREAILILGEPSNFITLDINMIRSQIERIPWIKQAYVRKQWPDKLKIHLIEYIPIARWEDLHLIDVNGNIFKIPEDRINNKTMPTLYGPKGKEQDVIAGYYTLNKILLASDFKLKSARMNNCYSWKLTLQNDIQLQLGKKDSTKRLQQFINVYPILFQEACLDKKRISYVDLRYDSGLAVGWASSCTNQ